MEKITMYNRYRYKDKIIDVFDCFNTEVLAFFKKHNIPESEFSKSELPLAERRKLLKKQRADIEDYLGSLSSMFGSISLILLIAETLMIALLLRVLLCF